MNLNRSTITRARRATTPTRWLLAVVVLFVAGICSGRASAQAVRLSIVVEQATESGLRAIVRVEHSGAVPLQAVQVCATYDAARLIGAAIEPIADGPFAVLSSSIEADSLRFLAVDPTFAGLGAGIHDVARLVFTRNPASSPCVTSGLVVLQTVAGTANQAVLGDTVVDVTQFTQLPPVSFDLTPPAITLSSSSVELIAGSACTATLGDYRSLATVTDVCLPTSPLAQSPAPGTVLGLGIHVVTFTSMDAEGNVGAATLQIVVAGTRVALWPDADGDGFGSSGSRAIESCTPVAGYATNDGDCADFDVAVNPGVAEFCGDFIDNNCNTLVEEGCSSEPVHVSLAASTSVLGAGATFTVRTSCSTPPYAMNGFQMAIQFDKTRLRLDSVAPVDPGAMSFEIAELIDSAAGTLVYALGLSDPDVPLTQAAALCDLEFTVLPGADLCGTAELVHFVPVGPFTTMFSTMAAVAVYPVTADLAPLTLDATPPVLIGLPPGDIVVPLDAGSMTGATVVLPTVTAVDACDGPVAVTVTAPLGGFFPLGSTTVTWTATDHAGNIATATRTVIVEAVQLLDLEVGLTNMQFGAVRHALRISVGGSVQVVDALLPEWTSGTPAMATVTGIRLPPGQSYACAAVKSVGAVVSPGVLRVSHTLSASAPLSISGGRYHASCVLLSGDSTGEDVIDILDYSTWVIDRSNSINIVRPGEARSNLNGDGFINTADFAVLAANFFRVGESCTAGAASQRPRERVSAKELRRMGLGELVAADLNHDGWVDMRDVQLAGRGASSANGARQESAPHAE